jgi:hypothetical protein
MLVDFDKRIERKHRCWYDSSKSRVRGESQWEKIRWDDVNALAKLALQRADLYDDGARWAGRLAELNGQRLESGEITGSTVVEVFRKMESDYLEQRDSARASARLMWSS